MASDARGSSTAKAWVLAVRGKRETIWSGPYRTFGGGALCVCLGGGQGRCGGVASTLTCVLGEDVAPPPPHRMAPTTPQAPELPPGLLQQELAGSRRAIAPAFRTLLQNPLLAPFCPGLLASPVFCCVHRSSGAPRTWTLSIGTRWALDVRPRPWCR